MTTRFSQHTTKTRFGNSQNPKVEMYHKMEMKKRDSITEEPIIPDTIIEQASQDAVEPSEIDVSVCEIYKENTEEKVVLKSELEPKMKLIADMVINREKLKRILNKKDW